MPNQDQRDQLFNLTTSQDPSQHEPFQPIALSQEDQEHYDDLKLPKNHPHTMAQALLSQLERMPLLEEQATEQSAGFGGERIALLA